MTKLVELSPKKNTAPQTNPKPESDKQDNKEPEVPKKPKTRFQRLRSLFSKGNEENEKPGVLYALFHAALAFLAAYGIYYYFGAHYVYKWGWPFWTEPLVILGLSLLVLAIIGIFVDEKPKLGVAIITSIVLIGAWSTLNYMGDNNFDSQGRPLKWVNVVTWEVNVKPRNELIIAKQPVKIGSYSVTEYWLSPKDGSHNIRMTKNIYDSLNIKRRSYRDAKYGMAGLVAENNSNQGISFRRYHLKPGQVQILPINNDECCEILNQDDLKITYLENGEEKLFILRQEAVNEKIPWKPLRCVSDKAQTIILKTWPYQKN